MKIIEQTYRWANGLQKRKSTKYIVLHHRGGNGDVQSIHNGHVSNGWSGIGYHFYVRKDGSVYRGRPIDTVGAHCTNYNSYSVGVCFEGNFETECMSNLQIKSGQEIISHLKTLFPNAVIKKHKDFNNTVCPGKNFPFNDIKEGGVFSTKELTSVNDIVWELNHRGIMTDKDIWLSKCSVKSNAYWLAYKIANQTVNSKSKDISLVTVNDLVWELNHRKIITDTVLWLKLLEKDENLYWLAYKAANKTKNK